MARYQMSSRRKIAIASWRSPHEGNIYGRISVDTSRMQAYIEHQRAITGEKITITHVIGKIAGIVLSRMPDFNGRIVFGRFIPYRDVAVAFLVQIDDGKNLAKVKVRDVHRKSLAEIAQEVQAGVHILRRGEDPSFARSMRLAHYLPTWVVRPLLWLTGFLSGALGVNIASLGLEAFPFGGCIITSLGMFELDEAFAPPTPFARVPLYILVSPIKSRPVVENGQVVARPILDLSATLDHRFVDGYQGTIMAKTVRECFEDPERLG